MATTPKGFELNKQQDTSQSVYVNYLPIGLNSIFYDTRKNYITASCTQSSSSNLTYTNNGKSTEYKTVKLWILGQDANNPLHIVNGQQYAGELIIQYSSTTGDNTLYVCFPLNYKKSSSKGQIDNLLNNYNNLQNNGMMTFDLNSDIVASTTGGSGPVVYIQYVSTNISPNATVLVYTHPLTITSINIQALNNTNPPIDMLPTPVTSYNIIPLNAPGDWMECDYVPIDSEEITTYNLPITSSIIQDKNTTDSFQTMILGTVFFFLFFFSYLIIPSIYLTLAKRFLGDGLLDTDEKKKKVGKMDMILSAGFIGVSLVLICVGAFTDLSSNPGNILMSGFCIGIIYTMGYIIIQSKKTNPKFIEEMGEP